MYVRLRHAPRSGSITRLRATECVWHERVCVFMARTCACQVAEARQLKEEEEALLNRSVRAMERLYGSLAAVRQVCMALCVYAHGRVCRGRRGTARRAQALCM